MASRGFTLLEILVVLTIIGMSVAVVGPRLVTAYDSVSFAMDRESFEQALADLPYQAFSAHADLVLRTERDARGRSAVSAVPGRTFPGLKAADIEFPQSWSIEVPQPIVYRASGFCSGGTLIVRVGDFSEKFLLRPPLCRPELESDARR